MSKDPKFEERWEFRRRDDEFNSSSDESKSSSSIRKKQNLLSSIVLSECVESQERNELDNATEKHIGSRNNNHSKAIKKRRDFSVKNNKQRSISIMESALWDDLKSFRESVVGELKLARETMFTQMKDDMTKLINHPRKSRKTQPKTKLKKKKKKKDNVDSTNCSRICIDQVNHDDQSLMAYRRNSIIQMLNLQRRPP